MIRIGKKSPFVPMAAFSNDLVPLVEYGVGEGDLKLLHETEVYQISPGCPK